jgi:hypothetical protein
MAMSDTERAGGVGKAVKPATKGRPRLGAQPLSQAERSRRARARRRAKPKPVRSAEQLFEDVCQERGITSAFDRVLAQEAVNALIEGDLPTVLKALSHLPAPRAAAVSRSTTSASAVREKVMSMILGAVAADAEERRLRISRGEGSEADLLRARLAEIERPLPAPDEPDDEVVQLRAEVERLRLQLSGAPADQVTTALLTERVTTPSEVVPPGEWRGVPRPVYGTPPGEGPILEHEPTKPEAAPSAPLTPAEAAAREDARARAEAIEQTRRNEALRQDYMATRDGWHSSGPFAPRTW